MALPTGTFALGPGDADLTVHPTKAGIGARLAHDLVIRAGRWEGTLELAEELADSSIAVTVAADSLEVVDHRGGVKALSDRDEREIARIIREEALDAEHFPEISFRSSKVSGTPPSIAVTGDLTVRGVTKPTLLTVSVDGPAGELTAEATVVQSDHGVTPYSALWGALRVADAVEVCTTVKLPA